jgi:hypothetical protein
MSAAFIGVIMDVGVDPAKVFKASGPSLRPAVPGHAGPTLSLLSAPGIH